MGVFPAREIQSTTLAFTDLFGIEICVKRLIDRYPVRRTVKAITTRHPLADLLIPTKKPSLTGKLSAVLQLQLKKTYLFSHCHWSLYIAMYRVN